MKRNIDVLFISHGGGPLPLLGDEQHSEMVSCLKRISSSMRKPSAILVVSAHWEEDIPFITAGRQPALIYDYYGFPEESYRISYQCPGEPVLADKVYRSLEQTEIKARLDRERGFDHGLFVPLKIMYPEADIPCIQLSLIRNLRPEQHINMGRSLQSLDYDNLLVIGSGFSFHNMKEFFTPPTGESKMMNESFDRWLIETCTSSDFDEQIRMQRLIEWTNAPYARFCHPREEHLLPLHVCYGLAGTRCTRHYELTILNKKSSMYLWTTDQQ